MMFSGMVVEELTDLPELGPDLFAGLIVPIEILVYTRVSAV